MDLFGIAMVSSNKHGVETMTGMRFIAFRHNDIVNTGRSSQYRFPEPHILDKLSISGTYRCSAN